VAACNAKAATPGGCPLQVSAFLEGPAPVTFEANAGKRKVVSDACFEFV
jgi:hypothetical protein